MHPAVQSKPPLVQLWTIPTCLIAGSQGEELSTSLSTSPPQGTAESTEVTPQPPFLQTRQTQSPQPLFVGRAAPRRTCLPSPSAALLPCSVREGSFVQRQFFPTDCRYPVCNTDSLSWFFLLLLLFLPFCLARPKSRSQSLDDQFVFVFSVGQGMSTLSATARCRCAQTWFCLPGICAGSYPKAPWAMLTKSASEQALLVRAGCGVNTITWLVDGNWPFSSHVSASGASSLWHTL